MHKIQVEEIEAIQAPGSGYVGWPTLANTRSGELMIAFSGGRRRHVCPFGQVQLLISLDEGRTWTWPRTLIDGPLDDRDAGVLETASGTRLVAWFTSLAWERVLRDSPHSLDDAPDERLEWERRHQRLTDEVRQRELGAWCLRSSDSGHTWSAKIPTLVNSPHGPCQLNDGRLLYVGKKVAARFVEGDRGSPFCETIGVAHSIDDGQSWQFLAEIAPLAGHKASEYHELHAIQAADGTIIAHIRNHNELHHHETLQTKSRDGGHTWSTPRSIGLWGHPAFLLLAADGRLITTVGHRREPHGNRIAVSEDNGSSWSESLPLNTDSAGDFGYPSTIELTPGRFISLWYDSKDREKTYLRLARWSLR